LIATLIWWVSKLMQPLFHWGAIYVPSQDKVLDIMMEFAKLRPGDKAVDLGSGDGRVIIALASAGAEAHGFEINNKLVKRSNENIAEAGMEQLAFTHHKSFWKADLSEYDIVFVYGMRHVMRRLEKKLQQELKPGAHVISNAFKFPTWTETKKKGSVYLYE